MEPIETPRKYRVYRLHTYIIVHTCTHAHTVSKTMMKKILNLKEFAKEKSNCQKFKLSNRSSS